MFSTKKHLYINKIFQATSASICWHKLEVGTLCNDLLNVKCPAVFPLDSNISFEKKGGEITLNSVYSVNRFYFLLLIHLLRVIGHFPSTVPILLLHG